MNYYRATRTFIRSLLAGAILTTLPLPHTAAAQVSVEASLVGTFDGNAYRNSLGLADFVTAPSVTLGYQPAETHLTLSIAAAAALPGTYTERRYLSNTFAATYDDTFGDDEENSWGLGMFYLSRFDRASYNFYDFNQFTAVASVKYYPDYADGVMGKAGYRFRSRRYSTLTDYSNAEQYAYVQAAKFFDTKTTLIAEFDFGYKSYSNVALDSVAQPGGSTGGMMGTGSGMGSISAASASPGVTQLSLLLRAAQALSPSAGLSIQYLRRWNPMNQTVGMTIGGASFQGDEELWDDPYGYEGPTYSAMLTAGVMWEMTMRASVEYADKSYFRNTYLATDVLTPTGPLRSDQKRSAALELRKTFDGAGVVDGITVAATVSYIRNGSNEAYYDYSGSAVSLGLEAGF